MSCESPRGLAIVVSGPSGSGKTTLVKHLMLRFLRSHFSISATTRGLRGEEVDGVDYRFMGREEFLNLKGKQGLGGRGNWFTAAGILLPVAFLVYYYTSRT